jgi:arylsulfatase A-like enzyme
MALEATAAEDGDDVAVEVDCALRGGRKLGSWILGKGDPLTGKEQGDKYRPKILVHRHEERESLKLDRPISLPCQGGGYWQLHSKAGKLRFALSFRIWRLPMLKPRLWCVIVLLGTALVHAGPVAIFAADSPARPNVILILMDDLGWADLECYGSTYHKTPNIDRLAAEGMRFAQAYAACPVCSPTRASILTGKWPGRLHLTDWLPGRPDMPSQMLSRPKFRQELPLEEVTLAEHLKKAGYATAHIGKWHLGGKGFGPREQGFDLNVGGNEKGSPSGYFAPFDSKKGRDVPGLEDAPEGAYLTDLFTNAAVKFIRENRDHPFFLYLPHFAVHTPLQAKKDLIGKYEADKNRPGQQSNPIYAAMLESADDSVGRIVMELEELKLSQNTIILFTSDNGGLATSEGPNTPATNNSPLREGKGHLYEGGIRVPLIVRWPGNIKPATLSETPVCSIDYLPTILELCGMATDEKRDGLSLMPLLKQSGEVSRDAFCWHYPHYSNQLGKPGGAIRAGDYKLIEFYEDGRRELFNLKNDPREGTNLADKEPDKVQELAEKLAAWRKSVDAQMMSANPDFHPNPQDKDGIITIRARTAHVHGIMLRYEPLPHKDTLGYWVRQDDWASFEFEVKTPGKFDVEMLVGCGNGSGGSEVEVAVGEQQLNFTVQETGGFQNFVPRAIGAVTLEKAGRHLLTVKPVKKPGPAVMDLRQLRLLPK